MLSPSQVAPTIFCCSKDLYVYRLAKFPFLYTIQVLGFRTQLIYKQYLQSHISYVFHNFYHPENTKKLQQFGFTTKHPTIRCLVLRTVQSHQSKFGDKILTRSLKRVMKSYLYEKNAETEGYLFHVL